MPTPQIDPATGERITVGATPQIDPATGERISTPAATPPPSAPASSSSQDQGVLHGIGSELLGAGRGIAHLFSPPSTPEEIGAADVSPIALPLYRMGRGIVGNEKTAAHQTAQYARDAEQTPWSDPALKLLSGARAGTSALLMADPLLPGGGAGMNEKIDAGKPREALGAGVADIGMLAGPEAISKVGGAAKGALTGDLDAPIVGSDVTPRQRFSAARRMGVSLDAADATNAPVPSALKRIGENSLAGGHVYDALKAGNTSALSGSFDRFLNSLYNSDREMGGRDIQGALKTDQARLKSGAEEGFDALTEQTKGVPIRSAPAVGETARSLLKPIQQLADKYPSLAPNKTMQVLSDLGRVGAKPEAARASFLDAPGSEFAIPQQTPAAAPVTWADLQRLRSGTHDLTTSSPDLVKSQAIAPLQHMTSTLDDAMTSEASGLNPAQEALFRSANNDWKDMKATYDDPQSPFYHAVRTDNPSSLFAGVGPKTPENARNLLQRLGPGPTPAAGALRRGTIESALKPTAEDLPNYKSFPLQLNRIPADYRAELFSPGQNETLHDLSRTSNVLGKDFNPSGTAKQGQKIAEAAMLVPSMGTPLLQYPLAKMMTNPSAVDWLMRERVPTSPVPKVAAGATAINARRGRKAQ